MTKHIFLAATIVILFSSCEQKKDDPKVDRDLNQLFALMQGSFNSEKQSLADTTYFNISLHMYPIWEERGQFLYVEQALNSMQDRPYRQRIYEIVRINDSTIGSYVYTIPNDSLWIGKWRNATDFETLAKKDIELRKGCEVLLMRKADNHFAGKTGKKTCESTLRGASYATSEVEIWSDKIISWDRGFDVDNNHVWGAEKGGYIFDKLD